MHATANTNDSLHDLDHLLWQQTPVINVPLYGGPIEPLRESGHRFLVAADGLWIEVHRPFVHVLRRIAPSAIPQMPFGTLRESIEIPFPVPPALLRQFADRARRSPEVEQAAIVSFVSETQEFRMHEVTVRSSDRNHVQFLWPRLPDGEEVVLDLHSHARHPAFFSGMDDEDDGQSVKFSGVIGNCDSPNQSTVLRLCILGLHIDLPGFEEMIK